MITFLTVLGVILSYLAIGAVYARSQSLRLYQKAKEEWRHEGSARESLHMMMAWRVAFWPYATVFDLLAGPVRTWMTSPLTARQARVEQLLRDAKHWDEIARHRSATPQEREMARVLAKSLREQAEELKL